jgi:hypothetical protein
MTLGQGVELGPFTFTVIRVLIAAGAVRAILRREGVSGGLGRIDWLTILWCLAAALSAVFHENVPAALVNRLGLVYNVAGIYFLLRIFCTSLEDVLRLCRVTALLLTVVALAMVYEQIANYNVFSILGGVNAVPEFREGRIRASGPFAHSILAGTVGATALPLMISLWRRYRATAVLGIVVCLTIVVASASSGPILSGLCALGGLALWRFRIHSSKFKWVAVGAYAALAIAMNAPVYYLLARLDLVGGSTGWYRARLIESGMEHLSEWWLAGTDYTRHWMVTSSIWNSEQADITNHYLRLGVTGGLPLVLLFVATLLAAFGAVGRATRSQADGKSQSEKFMLWALGSTLLAHAATCMSVSYFDQSFIFLYLPLAAIGSLHWSSATARQPATAALRRAPRGTFQTSRVPRPPQPAHRAPQWHPAVKRPS